MDELKYDRDGLLVALKANRDNHRAEFEKAMIGYEIEAKEQLDAMIKKVSEGKRPIVQIILPMPQDHTKDYDRVIKMLEMTIFASVELSQSEFGQYIMDDWSWKAQFTSSTAGYMAKAGR